MYGKFRGSTCSLTHLLKYSVRMKISKRFLLFIFPSAVLSLYLFCGTFPKSEIFQQSEISVLNFDANYERSTTEKQEDATYKVINVLLLAYARSGSSFTGELMSIEDDVFYVYEPSYEYKLKRTISDVQKIVDIIDGIFNCNNETLSMFGVNHVGLEGIQFFYPKTLNGTEENFDDVINDCKAARTRVIKTIRLPMEVAQQLVVTKSSLNLKIVHLVRDPRAVVNSMKEKTFWDKDHKAKISSCETIRKDLHVSKSIPKDKYIRVRYEDLSTNVLKTTAKLYERIGWSLTDNLARYISDHSQPEKNVTTAKEQYFSTFKKSDFDPNHWKSSLPLKERIHIEAQCKDVLEELNYIHVC